MYELLKRNCNTLLLYVTVAIYTRYSIDELLAVQCIQYLLSWFSLFESLIRDEEEEDDDDLMNLRGPFLKK